MTATIVRVPETRSAKRRALVVLGMHRSGTSAMTRTLSLLGAALPERLTAAAEDNEKGFWEPWKIANLNDEILEGIDSGWDDVFAFRPKQYLSNFDGVYLGQAVELLKEEFNGSELIVLKDPRISVLTPFWERALREAGYATHYVIMVRNPLEVAESLRFRNAFPREKALLLWSSYMIAIDRDTRNAARTFVSYDQLMGDWRDVRRRLEAGADMPFPRDTSTAAIEIDRFLDPRLHHHAAPSNDLFTSADVPEQVKTLYRIFSKACDGAEIDAAALEAIRAEMEELDLLVGPLLADLRGSTRALSAKVSDLNNACDEALERADQLQQELIAERALREAGDAAISQSNAGYESRITELAERLSVIEAERDRLAAELEAERDRFAAQIQDKERGASRLGEQLAAVEERLAVREVELAERMRETTRLDELLTKSKQEIEIARRDADDARRRAQAAATIEGKVAQQYQEIATLTEMLRKAEDEVELGERAAEEARKNAESAAKASEGKLAQRYQEVATLTNLLRHQEESGQQAEERGDWLFAFHEQSSAQSRWWNLVPREWRRRRVRRKLKEAGLFDGEAYLRRHPDVASSGMDPLDHYLKHGLNEGRARNF